MPRKFKFMDQPEHLRRRQALAEGTRGIWIACPLCGVSKKKTDKQFILLNKDGFIVQERAGGGRILGWFTDEQKSYTLRELKKMPEYKDVLDRIRRRCEEIIGVLK